MTPGSIWQRLFKPWFSYPVPPLPAVQNTQGFISPTFTTGSPQQQWNYGVLEYQWTFGSLEN